MALIKNLEILLSARTGKLDKDLNRALGSLRSFQSRVTGLVAAIGGTISFATAVNSVRRAFERIDHLADQSVGFGLLVQDLQAVQLSAGLAGVSVEQLTTAMSRLLRVTGQAAAGDPAAKGVFQQLKINPQDFARLGLVDQVQQLATAFDKIENPVRRAQLAISLFGRSGLALIPFLQDNSLQDAAKFIDQYGLGISQIDAAKIQRANDAWDALRAVIADLSNKAAIALAPALIWLAEAITRALRPGALLRGVFEAIGSLIVSVTRVVIGLATAISMLTGLQANFLGRLIGTIAAFLGFVAVMRFTITTVALLVKGLQQLKNLLIATQVLSGKLGWAKLAISAATIGAGILVVDQAIQGAEAQMAKFGETTDNALKSLTGLNARGSQTLNVGTAKAGSQEAIAQLYTIKIQGPVVSELQQLNDTSEGILNAIRANPAISGSDEDFVL